jgi:hypothetical protein
MTEPIDVTRWSAAGPISGLTAGPPLATGAAPGRRRLAAVVAHVVGVLAEFGRAAAIAVDATAISLLDEDARLTPDEPRFVLDERWEWVPV